MKRSLLVVISITATFLLIGWWRFSHSPPPATVPNEPISESSSARSTSNPSPNVSNTPAGSNETSPGERPHFEAASLPAQKRAGEKNVALQKAQQGIRDYRLALRQNPVGTNAEITRALLGKNTRGLKCLPADAPVNAKGELIDRWEQPVFFHQISGTVMEVRSAGPDHVMWTADDEVLR